MNALRPEVVGILPAGALGVSLFHHLTHGSRQLDGKTCFLDRPGSLSGPELRTSGELTVQTQHETLRLSTRDLLLPDPVTCFKERRLPGTLLVCSNPDQLLGFVTHCVQLLEAISEADELRADTLPFPAVVLCSNGIYHQRVRQLFVEKIEEATLYGRLPDLWPDLMPAIVGRWLRGVSIQTGVRDGSGAGAIYHPGPPGITRVAGGARKVRQEVVHRCSERGAWFEDADDLSPTRVEFDKAIVNLAGNLIGLLQSIDSGGCFHRLQIGAIDTPANRLQIDHLAAEVFKVGKAVRAYGAADRLEDQLAHVHRTLQLHRDHIPSSIQWADVMLRNGALAPKLTPTEKWLLEPLIRYAAAAGLTDTVNYFKSLEHQLITRLKLASAHRPSN